MLFAYTVFTDCSVNIWCNGVQLELEIPLEDKGTPTNMVRLKMHSLSYIIGDQLPQITVLSAYTIPMYFIFVKFKH